MSGDEMFEVCCYDSNGGMFNVVSGKGEDGFSLIVDCGRGLPGAPNEVIPVGFVNTIRDHPTVAVAITHWDADHYNLLPGICEQLGRLDPDSCDVLTVFCPPIGLAKPGVVEELVLANRYLLPRRRLRIRPILRKGDTFPGLMLPGTQIDVSAVVFEEGECARNMNTYWEINGLSGPRLVAIPLDDSNIVYLVTKGAASHDGLSTATVMFPGDVHCPDEGRFMSPLFQVFVEDRLSLDALVLPHHGLMSGNPLELVRLWRILATGVNGTTEPRPIHFVISGGCTRNTPEEHSKVVLDLIEEGALPHCLGRNLLCDHLFGKQIQEYPGTCTRAERLTLLVRANGCSIDLPACHLKVLQEYGRLLDGRSTRRSSRLRMHIQATIRDTSGTKEYQVLVKDICLGGIKICPGVPLELVGANVRVRLNYSGRLGAEIRGRVHKCSDQKQTLPAIPDARPNWSVITFSNSME